MASFNSFQIWMMWKIITFFPKYKPIEIKGMSNKSKRIWEIIITCEKMGWAWNIHKYKNIYGS